MSVELLFFGFVAFCIWAFITDVQNKKREREAAEAEAARVARLGDPAQVGTELARTTRQGDPGRMHEVVGHLPAWPVRDPLLHTAQWLAALTDGAGVAEAAGVHRDITDRVRATVEAAITELSAMAVKQVSLLRLFGPDWKTHGGGSSAAPRGPAVIPVPRRGALKETPPKGDTPEEAALLS